MILKYADRSKEIIVVIPIRECVIDGEVSNECYNEYDDVDPICSI